MSILLHTPLAFHSQSTSCLPPHAIHIKATCETDQGDFHLIWQPLCVCQHNPSCLLSPCCASACCAPLLCCVFMPDQALEPNLLQAAATTAPTAAAHASLSALLSALQPASGNGPCTAVWTSGAIAYRCKTCAVSPSSAVCMCVCV